jgi:succinate dehydrogenase/fumarate reductase flavoprotein subunit
MQLVNGPALVGRLLRAALDAGVEVRVRTPVSELLRDGADEGGRVTGVVAGGQRITATRGVVLAAGGFPQDPVRRKELFPRTPTGAEHWSLTPVTADGAGIALGESAGGRLDNGGASPAAWCPVSLVPYRSGRTGVFPHIMDRAKPGSIGVLSTGRRFVNEANGYYDYVAAMITAAPEGEPVQAWQVADARFVRRYPLGMAKPLPVPLWPYLRSGYLKRGRTLDELARTCGIDPAGLVATVERFNAGARRGEDPDFGRGATPFNRYGGDPSVGLNPSLAPLAKGPFYAVRIVPGSFGTFAGLATDARARVLGADDTPIPGLYAVGNDQASVMGGHYPAGGINIGPAMTFGYIAAHDLAAPREE